MNTESGGSKTRVSGGIREVGVGPVTPAMRPRRHDPTIVLQGAQQSLRGIHEPSHRSSPGIKSVFSRPQQFIESSNSRCWKIEGGVKRISVVSNGRTGQEWVDHFEDKGVHLAKYVRPALLSRFLRPTRDVRYDLTMFPDTTVFSGCRDDQRDQGYQTVRSFLKERRVGVPPLETVCLVCDALSGEELLKMEVVSLVVMHVPVSDDGVGLTLDVNFIRRVYGIGSNIENPIYRWRPDCGFLGLTP